VTPIAADAGVSVQTLYSAFSSKRGLLLALVDMCREQTGGLRTWELIERSEDPLEIVELAARLRRQILELCGDVVSTLRAGAAGDPDVAAGQRGGPARPASPGRSPRRPARGLPGLRYEATRPGSSWCCGDEMCTDAGKSSAGVQSGHDSAEGSRTDKGPQDPGMRDPGSRRAAWGRVFSLTVCGQTVAISLACNPSARAA
jgi:hypothetical protein